MKTGIQSLRLETERNSNYLKDWIPAGVYPVLVD